MYMVCTWRSLTSSCTWTQVSQRWRYSTVHTRCDSGTKSRHNPSSSHTHTSLPGSGSSSLSETQCFMHSWYTFPSIIFHLKHRGFWTIRFNGEIYKLYEYVAQLTYIQLKRWEGWAIWLEWEKGESLGKHFGGKRMIGRPWIKWKKMVKMHAKDLLDIRNWKKMAMLRD